MAEFDAKEMITRIERVIAEKGMSKEEFYAESGISSASFSQWNTGVHKPTLKKVFSAAKALCIDPDYLLGRIDTPILEAKIENNKIVILKPKRTEEEKREFDEWDEEETYKAAKQLVDSYENKKSPAPLGAELTKESIQMLLDRMSAEDLSALIADAASELARRNGK